MATSGVDAVTLDPWQEPGIPLDEQYRSWKQRIKAPDDKHEVDAYTRTRVILMNGIEVGAWNFSHHFSRSTDDLELRSALARTRMAQLGHLPAGGETVQVSGWSLEVLGVDHNAIQRLRLRLRPSTRPAGEDADGP
jgi:hypothetical protein